MKTKDYFKSTTYFYNSLFLKNIMDYNLSLNEFILLNYFINMHSNCLDLNQVEKETYLSSSMILEAYNGLIEKKIITIDTSKSSTGIVDEKISLDNLINKIDESNFIDNKSNDVKDLYKIYNKYSNSEISDNEKEIIKTWLESGFTYDKILESFETAKYNGVFNIRYIDKYLNEKNINNSSKKENKPLFDYDWLDEK